jgi:hypothetical protein
MVHIENYQRDFQKTCHVYILNLLDFLHRKANLLFEKFIVDQIKAIDDNRVTSKKRTGILSFVRVFPV